MSDDLTVLGPDGIRRSYDEHYDTMMDVEQDPTGAWQAIQKQADRIEELEAKLAKAVEALQWLKVEIRGHGFSDEGRMLTMCISTLAELTGGKDE